MFDNQLKRPAAKRLLSAFRDPRLAVLLLAFLVSLVGCKAVEDFTKTDSHRLFSPDKFIIPPERSPINPILSGIGLVDQTQELVPNATFPQEGDWEYTDKDYVIGPTDVVQASILDLFQEGQEIPLTREVSDTGYIDLPLLPDRIKAEGLTKDELTQAIIQAYSPNILRNPTVSVAIIARRQNTYYILGAVARPNQYMIPRRDMRLLEALAVAGGPTQNNIPYVYVIRPTPARRKASTGMVTNTPGTVPSALPELPEVLPEEADAPAAPARTNGQPSMPAMPAPIPPATTGNAIQPEPKAVKPSPSDLEDALRELGKAMPPGTATTQPGEVPSPALLPSMTEFANNETAGAPAPQTESAKPKWVYRDGNWARVVEQPTPPPVLEKPSQPQTTAPAPATKPELVKEIPNAITPGVKPAKEASPQVALEKSSKSKLKKPEAPAQVVGEKTRTVAVQPKEEATSREPAKERQPGESILHRENAATRPAQTAKIPGDDPFGWKKSDKSDLARVIAVNLQKLNDGDPRQNIVIRDNDIVSIPFLPVGEFYVTGEVLRPGVYSLPSRPINVKQALAAAGNVGPLAWPENSILIRRIGNNQEQIFPLNVEAIFQGKEPDIFLKLDDVIAVGTDVRAPFYAVFRNAFRMTYGFGFIYDRNFSPIITSNSQRFSRW
jgi:protein involved in polysaccharide export with SLBB domain